MNKRLLYTLASVVGVSLLTACDNYDDRYTEEYSSVVRFDVSGEQTILVESTDSVVSYDFEVKRSGHNMNAVDAMATVRSMTDDEWNYYSSVYSTKHYTRLPKSCYKFIESGVADSVGLSFPAAESVADACIEFDVATISEFVDAQVSAPVLCVPLTMDVNSGSVYSERKNLVLVLNYKKVIKGMVFEDDFQWLNVPAVTTPAIMNNNTNKNDNIFLPSVVAAKGLANPGWYSAIFDLNADHTKRLAPDGDKNPDDIFSSAYSYNFMHPGFIKLGATNYAGAVVSPALEKLGDQKADVEVTLQLCGCTSAGSATTVGAKDGALVYVGLWDGSDGEIEGADHDQKGPAGWIYKCKSFQMRNYAQSLAMEHGNDYDPWAEDVSMYTLKIKGATAKTRLYIFGGGYLDELKGRPASTITLTINGETKTYQLKPNLNRIGLKGCWVRIID